MNLPPDAREYGHVSLWADKKKTIPLTAPEGATMQLQLDGGEWHDVEHVDGAHWRILLEGPDAPVGAAALPVTKDGAVARIRLNSHPEVIPRGVGFIYLTD